MIDRSPPLLSLCVPTLRGYDQLLRLLRSIEQHTPFDHEVIIVDSGSRTRGYPVPMNQALDSARGRVVMALNDDVQVTPGWAAPLIDEALSGTPVCFPDQSSLEGLQCITGACIVFRDDFLRDWRGFDERYTIWCSDIDLCKYLDDIGMPAKRVAIPIPLVHEIGATQNRPDMKGVLDDEAVMDLARYRDKWGTDPLQDKFALAVA